MIQAGKRQLVIDLQFVRDYPAKEAPNIWKYVTKQTTFCSWADDFGVLIF